MPDTEFRDRVFLIQPREKRDGFFTQLPLFHKAFYRNY
jgi:hypothetical protein